MHTLCISIFKTVDFQKCETHHILLFRGATLGVEECRGLCPGGLLRYQPAWFSEDTFQLQWSMSFEGYVVVFQPLNAYKCHGCCENLILLVLGAGFPCKWECTQKVPLYVDLVWILSFAYLMTYRRLQIPQIPWVLFVIGLHICADSGISETLNHS